MGMDVSASTATTNGGSQAGRWRLSFYASGWTIKDVLSAPRLRAIGYFQCSAIPRATLDLGEHDQIIAVLEKLVSAMVSVETVSTETRCLSAGPTRSKRLSSRQFEAYSSSTPFAIVPSAAGAPIKRSRSFPHEWPLVSGYDLRCPTDQQAIDHAKLVLAPGRRGDMARG